MVIKKELNQTAGHPLQTACLAFNWHLLYKHVLNHLDYWVIYMLTWPVSLDIWDQQLFLVRISTASSGGQKEAPDHWLQCSTEKNCSSSRI